MRLVEVTIVFLRAHHIYISCIVFIFDQSVIIFYSICTFRRDILGNLIFVYLTVMLQFALKLLFTLIEDISVNTLILAEKLVEQILPFFILSPGKCIVEDSDVLHVYIRLA